ncbi:hypothetical protein AR158_C405R [Paramecium bursaria Chlorella virus AR158]|uniref:hypothetical protein n=1 Tax=Paramecium bursaria Chlorella virus AR158 TaxID=380598 RepID=UPI00015AA6BD|nr:hypothetical protein AR158_C405R [Paramecium bursaria Chlorella virus AR158]ABU43950.1 hypothetical protein AR158_C405R [Paramecium bursaria Chlorella virus AR158]
MNSCRATNLCYHIFIRILPDLYERAWKYYVCNVYSKSKGTLNEIFFRLYKCSSKFMYVPRRSSVAKLFIFRSLMLVNNFNSYQLGV